MADVVNNGNDNPAVKPGDAAGSNSTAGFQSFADFERQMAAEEAAAGPVSGAATKENDAGVHDASRIADQQAEAAAKAAEAAGATDEDEDEDEGGTHEDVGANADRPDDKRTPEQKAADEQAAKGPAKAGLKKRLGELVREKHEEATARSAAEARAAAAEERARLAEEAAARGEKPTARKAPSGDKPAPAATSDRPKAEDFEFGEYDPNYQDALVEWRVEQSLAKRDAKTAEVTAAETARRVEAERTTKWGGVIEKGAAKNTDFEEKVLSGSGWKLSKQMWEMSVDSDVGHDVLYHLASNPDESARIFDLPLTRQAAEFGKLEARFAQPSSEDKSAAKDGANGHMPKAPKPQTRVRGAGGQYKTDAGTKDFAAFEAMMKAEDAARAAKNS